MLYGINTILTGALLQVLSDMGHSDEIVIADGNFPATSKAIKRPPIWVPTPDTMDVVRAILGVLPLDEKVIPAYYIVEDTDDNPMEHHEEFQKAVKAAMKSHEWNPKFGGEFFGKLHCTPFYERTRNAYAVVATTDKRYYACYILRKGVLPEK